MDELLIWGHCNLGLCDAFLFSDKGYLSYILGTIPVVIGAPNIQDFAPAPGSLLHIKEVTDVDSVAKRMKYLAENTSAFNMSLRYAL